MIWKSVEMENNGNRTVDVVFTHDSLKYVHTCHDPVRLCNRLEFHVACPPLGNKTGS
jgi:hypothetical protein